MPKTEELKKLVLLASLYVSQIIPVHFLLAGLPVIMRQKGMSLDAIGALSLLAVPAMLKFLWSPFIDRYSFKPWGHYRFWIIIFQLLVIGVTVVCAGVDIDKNLSIVLVCTFLMSVFCSSQDIATDALAVGLLKPNERSLGNGVQTGGHYLGTILGGGTMLILLNRLGWTNSLLIMALIMVVALIPILRHKELHRQQEEELASLGIKGYFQTLSNFCRRRGTVTWLLILVLYSAGSGMASTMFRPLLSDLGLSIAEIGWLLGVVSCIAGILGAIAGSFLIPSLGRKRSLLLFGLLRAIAIATYLLPASGVTNLPTLYLAVISVQMLSGAAQTTLYTVMMDKSELATAGTDFTIQASIIFMGAIGASVISGVLAKSISYSGVFLVSIAISLVSVLVISRNFDNTNSPGSLTRKKASSTSQ
jgi:PAT family beta-lactamase induction signal transducer AmpG